MVGKGPAAWTELESRLPEARRREEAVQAIEKGKLVEVARGQERLRLDRRRLEMAGGADPAELARIDGEIERCRGEYAEGQRRLAEAKLTSVRSTVSSGSETHWTPARLRS